MKNKFNSNCFIHNRSCSFFCAYSKCEVKILCQKCVNEHLQIHPNHFIYDVENLSDVHSFDKLIKLKQTLGRQKINNEQRITKIYDKFDQLTVGLINKLRQFEEISKDLATKQFLSFLSQNKVLIEACKIKKSDPSETKSTPEIMIDQIVAEFQLILNRQSQLKINIENFILYVDSLQEMIKMIGKSMDDVTKKTSTLLQNCQRIQKDRFQDDPATHDIPYKQFFDNYMNKNLAASNIEKNKVEMALVEMKKQIKSKDDELNMAREENRILLNRIEQLNRTIEQYKNQINDFKSKEEREERERKEAISIARQKMEDFLIRGQIVLNQSRTISMEKKNLEIKYIDVLLEMVRNPTEIILSQHYLPKQQLFRFMYENQDKKISYKMLKILRMSFMPIDIQFLEKALNYFQKLHTLELNTCNIDSAALEQLSPLFPKSLKHLHMIDNQITNDGIEKMLNSTVNNSIKFESLFLSYNKIDSNAVESIIRNYDDLKILHISRNPITNKAVASIAKGLRNLEELFIGGTEIDNEGVLNICKYSFKLKRLSLVATSVSSDIVSEILLALPQLEWLDLSYSKLVEGDIKKIEKIKSYNKSLEIVIQN